MKDDSSIYFHHAEQYERLVSREDYQGNLPKTIAAILPLEKLSVVEMGAGTGRVTRLLAPVVRDILALDNSLPMLRIAQSALINMGCNNYNLAVGDHRHLPVKDNIADLIISGWSLCYLVSQGEGEPYPDWQFSLETATNEIGRILRIGGTCVIIETLGTGFEAPHLPEHLKIYYQWLNNRGFLSTWTRTDYRFHSLIEAEELTRFFFGDKLAQDVIKNQWTILPECTGIWWKKKLN